MLSGLKEILKEISRLSFQTVGFIEGIESIKKDTRKEIKLVEQANNLQTR